MAKRVLNIGCCSADHFQIERLLREEFGAETVSVARSEEALQAMRTNSWSLVLINRVFDVDGESGLDLLAAMKSDRDLQAVPTMLVSNYADAQQQASSLGAEDGFGKSALHAPETREKLAAVLE